MNPASDDLPLRADLVSECVRVMRRRLQAGDWEPQLPGERRLAERLQVGRDTLRAALAQLERSGWVTAARPGRRRAPGPAVAAAPGLDPAAAAAGPALTDHTPPAPDPTVSPARIGFLSPRRLGQLPQPMLLEVDQIRLQLASRGQTLEVFAPGWLERRNPSADLARLVREEPCAAWMLYRSTAAVQRWFADHAVPCLVRGYPQSGVGLQLPHIDVDWLATARHASAHLWRLGHRRVGVLVPAQSLAGVAAAVRGVLEFDGADWSPVSLTEHPEHHDLIPLLQRTFELDAPPTALITTRPRHAVTLLTWLGSQNLQVPRHLSVVTLAHEPVLDHLVPRVSCYRIDPVAVARVAVRRLERLARQGAAALAGRGRWLEPAFDPGASTAAPGRIPRRKW